MLKSAQKISISLPENLYVFITKYQEQHNYSNRSAVIGEALRLLQQKQLAEQYCEAEKETAKINAEFETTIADGLENNETW